MSLSSSARFALLIYCALVISSAALAIVRLSQSMEMPGLQAIELVLLALPWSLALGVEPFSRAGISSMAIIVFAGVVVFAGIVLNGIILQWIGQLFVRRHLRPNV